LCNNDEAHHSKKKAFPDWLTGNIHKQQIRTLVQKSAGYALRYLTHRFYKVLYFKAVIILKSANSIENILMLCFLSVFVFHNLDIYIQE